MCVRVRACVHACVCVRARADPIILVFAPGIEYGMYLNIAVIVMCFVASDMMSLSLTFLFVLSYCKAQI